MTKRRNKPQQEEKAAQPAQPAQPEITYPTELSPFAESRSRKFAKGMMKEVKPVTSREAFKTILFAVLKLIAGAIAVIVDLVTNHNFISPNQINIFTIAFAGLLMMMELFVIYYFYAWREAQDGPDKVKSFLMFALCLAGTILDFVATVVPVRQILVNGGSAEWLAIFMGILAAGFTSAMQVEFYPQFLTIVKTFIGGEDAPAQ